MEVADRVSAVLGWRLWDFDTQGRLISPMWIRQVWDVNEPLEAQCRPGKRHAAPYEGCACGIYATRTPQEALSAVAVRVRNSQFIPAGTLLGSVALWGKVIEHEGGFRAQYAYPSALYFTPLTEERTRNLAASYNIVALPFEQLNISKQELEEIYRYLAIRLAAAGNVLTSWQSTLGLRSF